MGDEKPPGNETGTEPVADEGSQSATSTEEFAEVRHIVDAGVVGACALFLAAILGISKIDTHLTIAIVAFAFALPTSTCGFIFTFPNAVIAERRIWTAEIIGYTAFIVGVIEVLDHLTLLAAIAFVVSLIILLALVVFWNEPERRSAKSNSRQHKKQ